MKKINRTSTSKVKTRYISPRKVSTGSTASSFRPPAATIPANAITINGEPITIGGEYLSL